MDTKLTIANLMIGMMMADGDVDKTEHDELMLFFTTTFNFSPEKAHKYIITLQNKNQDEALLSASQKIVSTHSITEQKNILSTLWKVAFADGQIDSNEEKYFNKIVKAFGIPNATVIALKRNTP
ncbi:MAG: TerB family tellurite resistance protein [Mariprofundaceae bacterium]